MTNSDGKRVSRVLATLFAFDVVLTVWAFGFSRWWFFVFHGLDTEGQDVHGFLRRCGANWAAFALFQLIALLRWRRDAVWLAVVAGLRLSDIFTDATYVLAARDTTLFARIALAPMALVNLAVGLYMLRAYRAARATQ